MVDPVDEDARGIMAPGRGLRAFRLDRRAPTDATVRRFVDRFWIVSWDRRGAGPFTQRVFAHPVVNLTFGPDAATVTGVTTTVSERTLSGRGSVLGVMFRPAGFWPLLDQPLRTLTDRAVPAGRLLGSGVAALAAEVAAAPDDEAAAAVEDWLSTVLPDRRQPSERTGRIAERVAGDRTITRVDELAGLVGISPRQLQRRFADHVGLSPKQVIRRYRLYEVAERAREDGPVDWSRLAAELGYSDQAHLTRDFSAVVGTPPGQYARRSTARAVDGPPGGSASRAGQQLDDGSGLGEPG